MLFGYTWASTIEQVGPAPRRLACSIRARLLYARFWRRRFRLWFGEVSVYGGAGDAEFLGDLFDGVGVFTA